MEISGIRRVFRPATIVALLETSVHQALNYEIDDLEDLQYAGSKFALDLLTRMLDNDAKDPCLVNVRGIRDTIVESDWLIMLVRISHHNVGVISTE